MKLESLKSGNFEVLSEALMQRIQGGVDHWDPYMGKGYCEETTTKGSETLSDGTHVAWGKDVKYTDGNGEYIGVGWYDTVVTWP